MNSPDGITNIYEFLRKLEKGKIDCTIAYLREDWIMVTVAIPGELWEVEFHVDGEVFVEKYKNDGQEFDEKALDEIFLDD